MDEETPETSSPTLDEYLPTLSTGELVQMLSDAMTVNDPELIGKIQAILKTRKPA